MTLNLILNAGIKKSHMCGLYGYFNVVRMSVQLTNYLKPI